MAETIGFIGLGIMGKPMAKNLIKAGHSLVIYNRTQSKTEELVSMGADLKNSPKEVSANASIIITIVSDSPEVESVILGKNGIIEGIKEDSVVIDMSSISPITTLKIAKELDQRGVSLFDAPVSGGEVGAMEGTLSIMVGGDGVIYKRIEPVLMAMGKSVVRVGEVGAGGFTKLSNQIIVAGALQSISEAMVLAKKAGVDMQLVYQAIKGGMAGGRTLDMKIPAFVDGKFKPGFKMDLHIKDLKNALLAGKSLGGALPSTGLIHELFSACSAQGEGQKDHSVIFQILEQLSGLK